MTQDRYYDIVIQFARGFSWALVTLCLALVFFTFLPFGFFLSFSLCIVALFVGMIVVGFFEILSLMVEILREKRKQTALLEEILASKNS